MDVGIDLGTTYSVIAVKGEVQLADAYPPGRYLPECGVTIIPTPDGDATFASVFWVDPQDPDNILIGSEAKQKADEGHSPIMFSKRSIGTDEPLRIHDLTYTAREVAREMLRHLKGCAERAVGQSVRRAVITHPAYFDPNQVQETRAAAAEAGFDMSLPEQMLMEPAAAALAYIQEDERDPLRVMTYDLGGGTFDVTVLERREGVITMKAFDGDHLLGGYNFDRALVQEVLNRVKAAGREILYDEGNAEDRGRRARLLQIAESVKMKLSEQRSGKAYVDFRAQGILIDSEGKKVAVLERINREQYGELIREELERTVSCCKRALAKAGMVAEELDAILLVGGSTYGQWVMEAMERAFGKHVEPYNPDLCVAAGAAIKAAELPKVASGSDIEMVLDVATTSALPHINVSGVIRGNNSKDMDSSSLARLRVLLRTPQGTADAPIAVGDDGRFLFEDIPLLENEVSRFHLQVSDENGLERLRQDFTVQYNPEGGGTTDISMPLPKPLYLKTATGMAVLAPEGEPLPARKEVTLERLYDESSLTIPIYMNEEEIGNVIIENIPNDAGHGSKVIVAVEITEKNLMRGNARVMSRNETVAAECRVNIQFPPIKLPSLSELISQFNEMESAREQAMALSDDPEERTRLGGQGERLSKQIKDKLKEQAPDKQEVYRALKEFDRLVNPPDEDMDPPRVQFRRFYEECRAILESQGTNPELQPMRASVEKINQDATDAFTTKNHKKWAAACESLMRLYDRISKATGGNGGEKQELPPTPILKDFFREQVDSLRASLRSKKAEIEGPPDFTTKLRARCDEVEKLIDQMEKAVDSIEDSLKEEQALGKLQMAMRAKPQVEQRIRFLMDDVRVR